MIRKLVVATLLIQAVVICGRHSAAADTPLKLLTAIELPNVIGRIDHLAADVEGKRVFVAALGNNTVEVVDLAANRVVHTIKGLNEPQGVAYVKQEQLIAVANGGDGSCRLFDSRTFELRGSFDFHADADNLRYSVAANQLLVGYGDGAIGIIDLAARKELGSILLPGHPESFQFEANGNRIFVNVPTAKIVAVIDRKQAKLIANWPLTSAESNFPLALDEPGHRLFVGCRKPAGVLVYDTENGNLLTRFATVGDADDLFYDSIKSRLYAIGGEGFVFVHRQLGRDRFDEASKIRTALGARTGLYIQELNRMIVAVPRSKRGAARVLIYSTAER